MPLKILTSRQNGSTFRPDSGLRSMLFWGILTLFDTKGKIMLDDVKEKIAPMVVRLAEMRGYL